MSWLMMFLSMTLHLAAQENRPGCSLACVGELTVPIYPPLAVVASIQGEGTIEGRCAGDRVETAAASGLHKLLAAYLEKWIGGVRCAPDCEGSPVRFRVSFVLRGERQERPLSTTVFRAPNQFLVSSPPPVVNVNVSEAARK